MKINIIIPIILITLCCGIWMGLKDRSSGYHEGVRAELSRHSDNESPLKLPPANDFHPGQSFQAKRDGQSWGHDLKADRISLTETSDRFAENEVQDRIPQSPSKEERAEVFPPFNAWMDAYIAAPDAKRAGMEADGVKLAIARKAVVSHLIETDPEQAMELAVPVVGRRALPQAVRDHLEERVSVEGRLGTVVDCSENGRAGHRVVSVGKKIYAAYTYGRRTDIRLNNKTIPIHGVALDAKMAVSELPVRLVEPGEFAPEVLEAARNGSNRPVSPTNKDMDTSVAVLVGSRIELLSGSDDIVELGNKLLAKEAAAAPDIAMSPWTETPKTLLYISIYYKDQVSGPSLTDMNAVNDFMKANSYNKTSITTTFTPPLQLPKNAAEYTDIYLLRSAAHEIAMANGYNPYDYDLDVIRHNGGPGGRDGLALLGSRGCWLKKNGVGLAAHELGHNLGLNHADFWSTKDGTTIGAGSNQQYGNKFDVMGDHNFFPVGHFNAYAKNKLNWLPTANTTSVTTSGTYRVHAHDLGALSAGNSYGLKIVKDLDRTYWVEYRQHSGLSSGWSNNPWLANGVVLFWDPWAQSSGGSLLDTTPGSANGVYDSAIVLGRTFSDSAAGIHITTTGRGGANTDRWADVVVNMGIFPTNMPPTLTLAADNTNPVLNQVVTFTATAADSNGDALAYHWDFGDNTFGPNASSATKSWKSTGTKTVKCIVSDMKGGSVTNTISVTVGTTPYVTVSATDNRATETAGNNGTFTLKLSAPTATATTVNVTFSGTAIGGADYTVSGTSVTIPAGSTSATQTITPVDDSVIEGNETIIATLSPGTGYNVGSPSSATINITDNDTSIPTVDWITESQVSINENGSMTITAELSEISPQPVSVPLTVTGTASGTDYNLSANEIIIAAGTRTGTATIVITEDTLDEANETVILTMGTPTNASLGVITVHTATITDDDAPPTVAWTTASQASVAESGTMTVTAQLSAPSGQNVIVPFMVGGTSANTARTIDVSPITIAAGETTGTATITITADALDEPNETVILTMGMLTNANPGAITVHTATITDDDAAPTVAWATAGQVSAGESGTMTVTAKLSAASGQSVVVPFTVTGTADGSDYTITNSPITIAAGATTGTATITITADTVDEPNETVILTMGTPTNATLGTITVHTATITDDDSAPTVDFFITTSSSSEATANVYGYAKLSNGTSQAVTVDYTVTGGTATGGGVDYTLANGTLTFPPFSMSFRGFAVQIVNDTLLESNETIQITLSNPTAATLGNNKVLTHTITDNDAPSVAFTASSQTSMGESGTLTVTAQLSAVSPLPATVPFTVSGTATSGDYTISASSITIAAGETLGTATITIVEDMLDEANETVILTMGTPTNAKLGSPIVHTMTITDDDVNIAPVVNAGTDQTINLLSSVSWTPALISTSAWYDAADVSSITHSSGVVSQWNDKSGNGKNMVQAIGSRQPVYTNSGVNGRGTITFDGSDDTLTRTPVVSTKTTNTSVFIVSQPSSASVKGATLKNGDSNGGGIGYGNGNFDTLGNRFIYLRETLAWHDSAINYGTNANMVSSITSASNIKNYLNSNLIQTVNALVGTPAGNTSIGGYGTRCFSGAVVEVIMIDSELSTIDRQTVEGYLAHKWGLITTLPTDHPYKAISPMTATTVSNLDGTISDGNGDPLTTVWTLVSGPAPVSFANASSVDTTAAFTTAGTYTFRLTASDGFSQVSDDVVITVVTPMNYQSWAGGTFANNFTDTAPTSNPDGDSLTNLQEFAFGTDPTSSALAPLTYVQDGTASPGIPILEITGTPQSPGYRAVFARRKNYLSEGISYEVQFSTNLQHWKASSDGMSVLSGSSASDVEAVSVPFPSTVPLSADETEHAPPKFFRVGVSEN